MTLLQAVSSVLGQYAGFRGRARRAEFWWWNLFTLLVGVAVAVAEVSLGLDGVSLGLAGDTGGPLSTLLALALLLPNVTVTVRRLHDVSRSGWWLAIALVPFVGLVVLLVFFLTASTPGWNQHGPDPRLPADEQGLQPVAPPHEHIEPTADEQAPGAAAVTGATSAWAPPGWDLPAAAEPGAGRPAQDRGRTDDDPPQTAAGSSS